VLARSLILRRRSSMLLEALLMLRERPLQRIRSARSSAPLLRSRSDTRTPSLTLKQLLLILDGYYSGTTQVIQATLGDEVVLVPPGVSRTLVPFYGTLVFQIVYDIVVALSVRPDTGAFSRIQKGEAGSG
jgi:hypothetical protein